MFTIYYSEYKSESASVSDISRLEHRLGRELLFRGLKELYHLEYSLEDEEMIIAYDDNGKPYLKDYPEICFSITHCPGLIVCAFSKHPVGIDAESVGYFPEVLISRALNHSEKDLLSQYGNSQSLRDECFWRLWTLKEAYVKKSAVGVDTDLKAFSFEFESEASMPAGIPVSIKCSDTGVSCYQIKLHSGHILSLCSDYIGDKSPFDIVHYINLTSEIYEYHQSCHNPK